MWLITLRLNKLVYYLLYNMMKLKVQLEKLTKTTTIKETIDFFHKYRLQQFTTFVLLF